MPFSSELCAKKTERDRNFAPFSWRAGPPIAAIVCGVVGGVALIAGVSGLTYYLRNGLDLLRTTRRDVNGFERTNSADVNSDSSADTAAMCVRRIGHSLSVGSLLQSGVGLGRRRAYRGLLSLAFAGYSVSLARSEPRNRQSLNLHSSTPHRQLPFVDSRFNLAKTAATLPLVSLESVFATGSVGET